MQSYGEETDYNPSPAAKSRKGSPLKKAPSLLENTQGMMGTLKTINETRADQRRFSPQRVALKRVATTEIANGPPFQPQIME